MLFVSSGERAPPAACLRRRQLHPPQVAAARAAQRPAGQLPADRHAGRGRGGPQPRRRPRRRWPRRHARLRGHHAARAAHTLHGDGGGDEPVRARAARREDDHDEEAAARWGAAAAAAGHHGRAQSNGSDSEVSRRHSVSNFQSIDWRRDRVRSHIEKRFQIHNFFQISHVYDCLEQNEFEWLSSLPPLTQTLQFDVPHYVAADDEAAYLILGADNLLLKQDLSDIFAQTQVLYEAKPADNTITGTLARQL